MLKRSLKSQHGATLVEFAIAFIPFFTISILAIDFGFLLAQLSSIRRMHYSAGRHGVVQAVDCLEAAQDRFNEETKVLKLSSTADFSGSGPITVNGVRGLSFRVRATTPCVSCVVFPALRGPISYNSGSFFPFEDQNACL